MTQSDPLTTPTSPDRVFYAPGILLAADDFQTEQLYHRSRLARVLAYLHGSGTAAGLWVYREALPNPDTAQDGPPAEADRLVVEPGLAVDRLGRLVEVPRLACLRLNRWFRSQPQDDLFLNASVNGVIADVFIRFVTCDRGKTPAFAAGPFDALDAVQPSRLRDGYELSLRVRQEDTPPLPVSPWQIDATPADPPPAEEPPTSEAEPTQSELREQQARAIADSDRRLQALRHNALFDAWNEGTDQRDQAGLRPLPEHLPGQDPTDLFLARLTIPAISSDGIISRDFSRDVEIDNYSRRFVYPTSALAEWT
ncbi:MAG: hypothetical protein F6J95_026150 [Leptolyngbya sp. SIO1E4]|nr:hypothetical protein [Leptolyngbya sp. SIO1E4]